jgi:PAS domain S-box-containing protein
MEAQGSKRGPDDGRRRVGAPAELAVPPWVTARSRVSSVGERAASPAGHEASAVGLLATFPPVPAELLRAACVRSPAGMTVWSRDGRWIWCNQAFCDMVGYDCEELTGIPHAELTHPDDTEADAAFVCAALRGGGETLEREERYLHKGGSVVWASVRIQLLCDAEGEPLAFVSHVQDITERRHAQELLRNSERTLRAVIDNTPAMICVKGRDHRYRLVNREFALRYGKSSEWIIGRHDAELLPPSTLADVHARDLAVLDSGRSSVQETAVLEGPRRRVTLTTRFPLPNAAGAIDAVCLTATDITERRCEEHAKRERLECAAMIYSALAEDRLVLHAQPIVGVGAAAPMGAELLVRMRDSQDDSKLVAPSRFIPAAERHGLIGVIDEWVINRAVEIAAHRPVTVNVSATTICTDQQVDRIEQTILTSTTVPENLVFEITETAVSRDLDAAQRFATRMRRLGCAIALDDFGVGHGSFTYLRHLSVDYLKIDNQFVGALSTNEEDQQIVMAIVSVAHQFGLRTIAEGVEDQGTLDQLRGLGVDYIQGYFTGRPMPLPDCWKLTDTPRQGAANVPSI